MDFFNHLSKNSKGKTTIGIVFTNDKNQALFIKNKIDRINEEIYDIPFVKIEKMEEAEIINEVFKKYGIKITKILSYINEENKLDDKCNNVLRINLLAEANEEIKLKSLETIWESTENITKTNLITESLKKCLEIYEYNCLVNI